MSLDFIVDNCLPSLNTLYIETAENILVLTKIEPHHSPRVLCHYFLGLLDLPKQYLDGCNGCGTFSKWPFSYQCHCLVATYSLQLQNHHVPKCLEMAQFQFQNLKAVNCNVQTPFYAIYVGRSHAYMFGVHCSWHVSWNGCFHVSNDSATHVLLSCNFTWQPCACLWIRFHHRITEWSFTVASSFENVSTDMILIVKKCQVLPRFRKVSLNDRIIQDRRKFRRQTSDNMDRWKAGMKRVREESQKRKSEKRMKGKRRSRKTKSEKGRKKKIQALEKVWKSRNIVFF